MRNNSQQIEQVKFELNDLIGMDCAVKDWCAADRVGDTKGVDTVSYTHLTLPTILRV